MSSSPHGPGIAGDIVGPREDDDDLGLQIDHILAEAHQHLRRGLPSNAAVHVRLARKIFVEVPDVGDRVAEKHNAVLPGRRRLQRGIGVAVALQLAIVIGEDGDARGAVLIEPGKAGGGNAGRRLWCLLSDSRNERKRRSTRDRMSGGEKVYRTLSASGNQHSALGHRHASWISVSCEDHASRFDPRESVAKKFLTGWRLAPRFARLDGRRRPSPHKQRLRITSRRNSARRRLPAAPT